jgi:L,D-transpeptidase catalytic domain
MIKKTGIILSVLAIAFLFPACNNHPEKTAKPVKQKRPPAVRRQPAPFTYRMVKSREWLKQNDSLLSETALNILTAVNRTDNASIKNLDSILVPSNFEGGIEFYLHFPVNVPELNDINKIILFSYPAETFAAYENGELVYCGPTNMGRKKDPTPGGLYFCNWKAEKTTSTFNDEWDLKWNFNIENKQGIGFHEYALPGYPASHSCLRLREKDAKFLYSWADQWELKGTDEVLAKGTPVIVFGSYAFDASKPWTGLILNTKGMDMDEAFIAKTVSGYKMNILAAQAEREAYFAASE